MLRSTFPRFVRIILVLATVIGMAVVCAGCFGESQAPLPTPTPYPTPPPDTITAYVDAIRERASWACNINMDAEQLSLFVHGSLGNDPSGDSLDALFVLDYPSTDFGLDVIMDDVARESYCDVVSRFTWQLHNGLMDGYVP